MLPQPGGVTGFVERVVGKRQHDSDNFGRLGHDRVAVFVQECETRQESGALVAVHESVVLAQPSGVCGSEIEQIRLAISEQIARSGQRRFDGTLVADSRRTSEFNQAIAMKPEDCGRVYPNQLDQRASSRIAGA